MGTIYRHRTALRIRCREYSDIDDKLLVAPSQAYLLDHVLPYERLSTFDFPGLKINEWPVIYPTTTSINVGCAIKSKDRIILWVLILCILILDGFPRDRDQ